jgi:hypothetical protein
MKKLSKSFEDKLGAMAQNDFSSAVHYFKGALSRQKAFHHKAEELNVLQGLDLSDILEPLPKEMWRKVFAVFFTPKSWCSQ